MTIEQLFFNRKERNMAKVLTKLEHSDKMLKLNLRSWVIVNEDFEPDTISELKAGTLLRIEGKGPDMFWCLDNECNRYALDRKDMWYLSPAPEEE